MRKLTLRLPYGLPGPFGLLIFLVLHTPVFSFAQSVVQPASATRSDYATPSTSVVRSLPLAELHRYEAEARQVNIIRDRWGIPHIYGKTDAAAVFGLMYAECQTDFSRVEKNYLEMLGRQSEAYGESYLYNDVMMRLIYDSARAVADYQKSPSWMFKLLNAFADGVNYYLYKHPATQPLLLKHFEPWYALMFTDGSVSATSTGGIRPDEIKDFYSKDNGTATHRPVISAAERMVLEDRGIHAGPSSESGAARAAEGRAPEGSDLREPGPGQGAAQQESGPGEPGPMEDPDLGSNGFAIAPARSASGNALLYINPHVPFYFRMEVQLTSDEGLNAYGAVTWGQFFIYQGFNAHCGWMHTSTVADVADLYIEKVSRKAAGWEYEYEGAERPVTHKPFTVYYKTDAGALGSLPLTGYYTHHGPVMGSRDGKWLSLRENNRSLDALLEAWLITKARTFTAYKRAMDLRANTTNSTVYADDQGNIAYWHGNFMPRRDPALNWSLPVDGSVKATEWQGLHPLDEIVHIYNPSSGWIQNCNSTPYTASGPSSPDSTRYPAYMAPEGQNFRALNAARLLSAAGPLTLDSLIATGYDRYLAAFDLLLPALLEAYDRSEDPVKQALQAPVTILQQWDKKASMHSIATTLAIEWASRLTKYAPVPKKPEEYTNVVGNVRGEIAVSTAAQKMDELAAVIMDLQARFGDWRVEWGELCRYQRLTGKITERYDDRLSSLPVGLAPSAFGALPSFVSKQMPDTKRRYGYSGNSFVAAVEFGKKVKARTIVTGGASNDPASPHFYDQAGGYLEGRFKDVLFYKADVLSNMEKEYHPGAE